MAEIAENSLLIQEVETHNIMTKSSLPVGGYSVNPYVGCTHGCRWRWHRLLHQAVHRPQGAVGHVSGCQALAADPQRKEVCGTAWSSAR